MTWSGGPAESWAEEICAVAEASAYTIGAPAGCENDRAPITLSNAYQAQALVAANNLTVGYGEALRDAEMASNRRMVVICRHR